MITKKDKWSWFKKFGYAFRGIYVSLKEESSLVVHFVIGTIVMVLGIILNSESEMSYTDWCIVVLLVAIIISMELLNTAIENIIDVVMFEYNVNAKKIKDISAAATLVLTIASVVIGLVIFIPKIIDVFQTW